MATNFSPIQCKMARVAVGWGVRDLAKKACVSTDTVSRYERGEQLKDRTMDALREALERAGCEFTDGKRPGVRLTNPDGA